MILDNGLINGRPKELHNIEYYTKLPKLSTAFNYKSLPTFLNVDLLQLFGIMPKTLDLSRNTQFGFFIQPSKKEVEYYRKRNTRFQIVHVVANIHTFSRTEENIVLAYPYSISVIAGPKRGIPDECSIELLDKLDLQEISQRTHIYTDFSPFKPLADGFFSDIGFLSASTYEHYTDTIGFVLETYFLPTDIDLEDVLLAGPQDLNPEIEKRFLKYRAKRYFKPFENIQPRKIWGCDSPIELFLIQGLAQRNFFPVIQTLIFRDGSIYDNFFEMIKDGALGKGEDLITEADLFFPNEKVAVFCDSTKYHRGAKNKIKDNLIDEQLRGLGIKPVRILGKEITSSLSTAVQKVIDSLN